MSQQQQGGTRNVVIRYRDGRERRAIVRDEEVPYPDGKLIVSRTDPDGVITHANQAFVDMSGYTREELIGASHNILRHPDMPAAAFQGLWETVRSGRKWQGYVKNLCKDGRYYWVKATVIPNIRRGRLVGYTSVRRKPSRSRISQAETLYAGMQQGDRDAV